MSKIHIHVRTADAEELSPSQQKLVDEVNGLLRESQIVLLPLVHVSAQKGKTLADAKRNLERMKRIVSLLEKI
jgi:hypothetical protein